MANTKSAEKRIRQTAVRRHRNRSLKSEMRTSIKRLREAVAEGDSAVAEKLLPKTLGLVDRTAQKGAIHRNTAARTKSRLVSAVRDLSAG